jgi:ferredoxin like protein
MNGNGSEDAKKAPRALTLDDKIFLVTIKKYKDSHLVIRDQKVCLACKGKECTIACPVKTYTWEEELRETKVAYENCFECGTCRLACPYDNIEWKNPPGGFGVEFKLG